MFNSNLSATTLLSIENSGLGGAHTPKTPEILNSLIAMSHPLDNFNFSATSSAASTPVVTVRNFNGNAIAQSHSQDSSHSSCSASPLDSPAGTTAMPSVKQTCSQLIKAGLKLSIQSKRKSSTCDSSSGSEQPNSKCSRPYDDCEESSDDDSETKSLPKGLTPEDEDRRRRRRERNKIAATKCRMKKRERTQNLVKESEVLDTQNVELKNQVRLLETERRKLLEMLQAHAPACVRHGGCNLPSKLLQSPAHKYLAELELATAAIDAASAATALPTGNANGNGNGNAASSASSIQRMSIPSMSTFKFSNNKTVAALAAQQLLSQQQPQQQQQQQLPNGYCKPSPSPHEFEHAGYLSSPTQEALCLPAVLQQQQQQQQRQSLTPTNAESSNNNNSRNNLSCQSPVDAAAAVVIAQQVSDYVPNCDSLSLGLALAATASSNNSNNDSNNNNNNGNSVNSLAQAQLAGNVANSSIGSISSSLSSSIASVVVELPSPLVDTLQHASGVSTPSNGIEFVKNELVDSQSPYTTALSAERFLFEPSDGFPDIKHAVSVHPSSINNMTSVASLAAHNNNNHLLDFHASMLGNGSNGILNSCYDEDQMMLMKNSCYTNDLLSQLADDAADYVDLDTGAAAYMTNGGCLA